MATDTVGKETSKEEGVKKKSPYGGRQSSKLISSMSLTLSVHDTQEIKSLCSVLCSSFMSTWHQQYDKKKKTKTGNVNDMYMYITQLIESKMKSILLAIL
jgi:hypothetical protein